MINYTTVEADPSGAASFLRALKRRDEGGFQPDLYEEDWITRTSQEVQERLGRSSFWDNSSPVGRGWDYETLVDVSIGGTHPVIDDIVVYERIATSMKVMDSHAYSYQNAKGIISKATSYVDAFRRLTGVKTVEGLELTLDQIRGYHLEIAVRPDMTSEQREAFRKIQEYGREQEFGQGKFVRVIIAEVE